MQIFLNKLSKVFNQVKKYYNGVRNCEKRGRNGRNRGHKGHKGHKGRRGGQMVK